MSLRRAPLWLLLALCCCADDPLTQIVVVVDSDYKDFSRVKIDVEGFDRPAHIDVEDLDKRPLPRRLSLVHEGGPLGPISVTVKAYVQDVDDRPALVEPRTRIMFQRDKTRMLKIDLLWACVKEPCMEGEACLGPGECVSSSEAAKLEPWDSSFDRLKVDHKLPNDRAFIVDGGDALVTTGPDGAIPNDGGPTSGTGATGAGGSADPDTGVDGGPPFDSGPPEVMPLFTYEPSNFVPGDVQASAAERPYVDLDCAEATFDSRTLEFSPWCGDKPLVSVVQQSDGTDAALLVMNTFKVGETSNLRLVGDRPVIFAVFGDAQVFGVIDAGARGAVAGPGADRVCASAAGSAGPIASSSGMTSTGAGGGSGGGFGTAGGRGGAGGNSSVRVDGGSVGGNSSLSPLRGGCSGGRGGMGDLTGSAGGGGGGAVQISASGQLQLIGGIVAGGGGGAMGLGNRDGGGGGGSGGAILLEAQSFIIDSAATISANGGGGGGGQPTDRAEPDSTAGADAVGGTEPAAGGAGNNSGGDGGRGASGGTEATDGGDAEVFLSSGGGGGGGGGGAGRIRINQAGSCAPHGVFSPSPSVTCPSCADPMCPAVTPPDPTDCTEHTHSSLSYTICSGPLNFADARARCMALGLDLVHIDTSGKNAWIDYDLGSDWAWIGATDAVMPGTWRWVDDDSTFWVGGASGSAVGGAFEAWDANEPNGTGNCVRLEGGAWLDSDCSDTGPYVCR